MLSERLESHQDVEELKAIPSPYLLALQVGRQHS